MNRSQAQAALALVRLAAAHELLGVLVKTGTERQIGRRCLLLALAIDPILVGGNQRQLAARLRRSEARISQEVKAMRPYFGSIIPHQHRAS
ncbi:MAG: hypothetical protein ABSD29_04000 [Verrucomicrobiota bacterium]|jgi:hypothetical protein